MSALNENSITRLITVSGLDLNNEVPTELYRVPFGYIAIVTTILVHAATTALDSASWSFGFNDPDHNDLIEDASYPELLDETVFTNINCKAGGKVGYGGGILKIKINTSQGAPASMTAHVFGFLYKEI